MGRFVFFAACCYLAVSLVSGLTNGETAAVGQFPYIVGLYNKYDLITYDWCSGVLIDDEWVLTTTKCTEYTKTITVYLGTNERRSGGIKLKVNTTEAVIMHPDYGSNSQTNDIALIRIPRVSLTSRVMPVRLPSISKTYSSYAGDYAVSAGWGYTKDKVTEYAQYLQWAEFEIMTNDACKAKINKFEVHIKEGTLCVATQNSTSTCFGDYGGPLVLSDTNVLVGLLSFGPYGHYGYWGKWVGCEDNYPNMFTRITDHLQWIKEHTGIYY